MFPTAYLPPSVLDVLAGKMPKAIEEDSFVLPLAVEILGTPVPVSPPPSKKPAPRLTVVEHVTYERPGHAPVTVSVGHETALVSGEQAYRRELVLDGAEWKPLDTGWLGNGVTVVVVENTGKGEGAPFVFVGFGTGRPGPDTVRGLVIPPGKSHTLRPEFASRVWLATVADQKAPVTITAVPS